jgi:hypothetical protein
MNNARADMYHDLVCKHRKLSDEHSKLHLKLTQKGKLSRHTIICQIILLFFTSQYFSCRHITFYRHFSAATEEQVTELLKRIKELTCMPNLANLQISTLYFKSFKFFLIPLTSNPFNFESLQMKRLHWKHATRTVCPQWIWPSSWMKGMPPTKLRWSS